MPNAVLEPMAAGLPVVASAVPSNGNLVANRQLAGDSGLSKSFGRAARRLVEGDYS